MLYGAEVCDNKKYLHRCHSSATDFKSDNLARESRGRDTLGHLVLTTAYCWTEIGIEYRVGEFLFFFKCI